MGSEDRTYDDLTIPEFVTRYAPILGMQELSVTERSSYLPQPIYLAQSYERKAVLSFHTTVLHQIERRVIKWEGGCGGHRAVRIAYLGRTVYRAK